MTCNIEYCLGRSYRGGEYARTKVELVRSTVVTPGFALWAGNYFAISGRKHNPQLLRHTNCRARSKASHLAHRGHQWRAWAPCRSKWKLYRLGLYRRERRWCIHTPVFPFGRMPCRTSRYYRPWVFTHCKPHSPVNRSELQYRYRRWWVCMLSHAVACWNLSQSHPSS